MRYAKQPDDYSCGPVAILNAMKWAGLDATLQSHLTYLQFGCRTIDQEDPTDYDANGTYDHDFDRVLRYVGKGTFSVRRTKRPSVPMLRRHLMSGGAVAFCYHWQDGDHSGEHFAFLAAFENGKFTVVNDHLADGAETTVSHRTEQTLRKWLKKHHGNPIAWLISIG